MTDAEGDPETDTDMLSEVADWLARVAKELPQSVSVAELGVRPKAPFKAMSVRGALMWRTEELTRGAYQLLEHNDLAAAILLIRGVVESASLMARLTQLVFDRRAHPLAELEANLSKMLHGWKNGPEGFPEAYSVLTLIGHLDKRTPGVLKAYNLMSESAHPNWTGVSGLFSWDDTPNYTTYFGRSQSRRGALRTHALTAFASSLMLFDLDYRNLAKILPDWLKELEPLPP